MSKTEELDDALKWATWEYYFTPEAMAFSLDVVKEHTWGQACSAPSATLKNSSLCRGRAGDKYAYLVRPFSKDI